MHNRYACVHVSMTCCMHLSTDHSHTAHLPAPHLTPQPPLTSHLHLHHLPCLLDAHTAPGSDPSANHSHRCSGSHRCRDDGRWSGRDTFPHLTDSNLHLRQAKKWEATVTKCLCLICTSTANSATLGQLAQ